MDVIQPDQGHNQPEIPDRETRLSCDEVAKGFSRKMSSLPDSARMLTEQPEAFWTRQRAAIRSRIAVEQASRRPLKRFVLASALSLAILAGLLLRTSSAPAPVVAPQADPDQELLMSVEEAIQSNGPQALAPAALLAEEISSAHQQSQHAPKENPYAN
jgi:hypothetical protein